MQVGAKYYKNPSIEETRLIPPIWDPPSAAAAPRRLHRPPSSDHLYLFRSPLLFFTVAIPNLNLYISLSLSLSLYRYTNLFSSMNRRIIPFLFAVPQIEPEPESEFSLSPTAMGYPVGYADVIFPNAFLHLLFFLGYIRSLIVSLFQFLGLSDFLESGVVWPENPTSIFDDRSVSPNLIEEFVSVVKFSDIVAAVGFPPECCVVCLCEFQNDEEVRFLKNCKHIFHKECLDRWMIRDQRSCPLCRTLIMPEESIPPLVDFSGCSEFSGDYS